MKTIKFLVISLLLSGCIQNTQTRLPADELSGGRDGTQPTNNQRRGAEYRAPLTGINTHFNPACRNFIASDGSIGPWGREFVQAMREVEATHGESIFFGSGSDMIKFGARCRSTEYFNSLTESQQEHIWVWTWAAIAQAESSCNPSAQAQGIWNSRYGRYNRADGLMQLEYATQTRNANGRDTRFCPNNTDSQAISFQARCSASIMARAHSGRFLYTEGRSTTYWDKLRRGNGRIFNLLKRHPLCR